MKKKHWLIPVFAILCISIGIGIIMAYLSDDEVKTNEIEIAENKVSIQETFPDENKIQKQGGTEYQKSIKIKNTGNTSCYIRVFMEFPDSEVASKSFLSWDGKNYYSAAASIPASIPTVTEAGLDDGKSISPLLYSSKVVDLTKWRYRDLGDGYYYYYSVPVNAGEETEKLLESLLIYNADVTKMQETQLYVYTESLQIKDVNGTQYKDYEEAWKNFYEKQNVGNS